MKRIFSTLSAVSLAALSASAAGGVWPDGTPMDAWFSSETAAPASAEAKRFVVTDFGVVRDSTLLQTEALQRVIELAAEAGGTVVIPPGTFLSGSLFFRPGTHLFLEKGAVLKGSDDISDYAVVPVHIEGVLQPYVAALVNAYGCDGFSVRGEGVIDGNGLRFWQAFWARRRENPACTNLEVRRPRLFYAAGSRNVLLEGVTLRNPGFWTTHFYKCGYVRVKDVVISAPHEPVAAPSSDGIDLDGCNDVHITGCSFRGWDDLIALKGGKGPRADRDPDNAPNANILVENCRFGPGAAMLTFGSECIGARNVILRNCEGAGTARMLWLKMRPDTPHDYEYILAEGVTGTVGTVLYVHPWTQFADLQGGPVRKSRAAHVLLQDCRLECTGVPYDIVEAPGEYGLEDIGYAEADFFVNLQD